MPSEALQHRRASRSDCARCVRRDRHGRAGAEPELTGCERRLESFSPASPIQTTGGSDTQRVCGRYTRDASTARPACRPPRRGGNLCGRVWLWQPGLRDCEAYLGHDARPVSRRRQELHDRVHCDAITFGDAVGGHNRSGRLLYLVRQQQKSATGASEKMVPCRAPAAERWRPAPMGGADHSLHPDPETWIETAVGYPGNGFSTTSLEGATGHPAGSHRQLPGCGDRDRAAESSPRGGARL